MLTSPILRRHQLGTGLLEVLVTMVILSFGLLGLAGLHTKIQLSEFESYQRAQAIILLSSMTERINTNRSAAGDYVITGTIGTGDSATVIAAACDTTPGKNRDICEWRKELLGANERINSTSSNVGAMVGARGCITQVQAPDATLGTCTPAIYQVSVAWQGSFSTKAPPTTAACGKDSYGADDSLRRVISTRISVALTSCF